MQLDMVVRGGARRLLDRAARARLRRRFERALAATDVRGPELSVVLTDDAEVQDLNERFRGKDRPTDVLSFSLQEGEGPPPAPALAQSTPLGDVVISVETAARVRHEPGADLEQEILFLYSHGLCHLLGHDHRTDAEESAMDAEAARLRRAATTRV